MPHRVLNEDWSDYDNKKIRDNRDARFFSCEESWEVEYLLKKISRYVSKADWQIRQAISECCKSISGNKPRKALVECVMAKLS